MFSVSQTNCLMKISSFVGAYSALLIAWLGITFFHESTLERYPEQDRTFAAAHEAPADERIADVGSNDY